jgi:hypothetical protein
MEQTRIEYREKQLTGERALFMTRGADIVDCIFSDGESPLKESSDITVTNTSFQWKYPLWYCSDVTVRDSSFFEMARAGIWYTKNISLTDCLYQAPKGFRRVSSAVLENVDFPHADETLWNCSDIKIHKMLARGDYFAMNSSNLTIDGLNLAGNYSFDGCSNVTVTNSKLISKDAFWNCKNVTVKNSYISGEYTGWNSEDVTFEHCTLESLQGFCYMKNLKIVDCVILNTNLAFEYSTVDVTTRSSIKSVKNPLGGSISCAGIGELIFDDNDVNAENTKITINGKEK